MEVADLQAREHLRLWFLTSKTSLCLANVESGKLLQGRRLFRFRHDLHVRLSFYF